MNTRRFSHQIVLKSLFVLLISILAFQSFGMIGLAAPAAPLPNLQSGAPVLLSCNSSPAGVITTLPSTQPKCSIQIVLLIDDSGSMQANDKGGLRNQGASNLVDILADQHYLPALALKEENPNFQLPDVRVAVIHFSKGVKRNSGWIPIDPANLDQWKEDLKNEINWPGKDKKEFYSTKQYTSFSEAFGFARRLLLSNDVQSVDGDCTRRAILLFTDGTPESEKGILIGDDLNNEMNSIESTVKNLQDALPEDFKVKIYFTGFKFDKKYKDAWAAVEKRWQDNVITYAQDLALEDQTVKHLEFVGEGNESLDALPARMEAIAASLMDAQSFAVEQRGSQFYPFVVPSNIESVRFTLYNSDTAASLEIKGPDGNVITIENTEVIEEVTGQGTPIQVWKLKNPDEGTYLIRAQDATRSGIITRLLTYRNLLVEFDKASISFLPGEQSDFQFRLFDSSNNPVVASTDSTNQLKLNVTVTQGGESTPLEWTLDGDQYKLSWTPKSAKPAVFNIELSSEDVRNGIFLNCLGSIVIDPFSTITPTFTPTSTSTVTPTPTVTLTPPPDITPASVIAIFPQCVPPGEVTTLPMKLEYGDAKALPSSLEWKGSAVPDYGTLDINAPASGMPDIDVSVNPLDTDRGEFELRMGPVSNEIKAIQLQLTAVQNTGGQPAAIFKIDRSIEVCQIPVCDCNTGLWAFWFWPLVIVLAGLLILLLVLRFRNGRDETEERQGIWNIFRTRDWHLLFWPLLVLLILLLLVRLMEWCCILPPWLFLVSILAWLVMLLLMRFIPGHRNFPKPRPWWLVLLLLALIFAGYLTITVPAISLLWLLLLLLVTWLTLWYISVYQPMPPAVFSLAYTPSCVPFNESITLPLRLDYQGEAELESSPVWSPSAKVMPGIEVGARIITVNEERGEYELIIDPVPYAKDAKEIQVQVRARADLADGRSVEIFGPTTTIPLCQPDDLAELEGIGDTVRDFLYSKGVLTFKQLAMTNKGSITSWLDTSDLKMMDPKTWPQQAKLADIAKRYRNDKDKQNEEDKQNYEAYKAWLRNGIEPDEYDKDEPDRRPDVLVWNKIANFTPLVLNLAVNPSPVPTAPITLPIKLNPNGDKTWLTTVKWEVGAKTVPGGEIVGTRFNDANPDLGEYELVIDPVTGAEEIQVSIQATVNGRSIEFYGKAITVQIPYNSGSIPPLIIDDLTIIEGIGPAVAKLLNENGIYSFSQLAGTRVENLNALLDKTRWAYMDPKTWPHQAELAEAMKSGKKEDLDKFNEYVAWVKAGIAPDEYKNPESTRKPPEESDLAEQSK